jgi:hypothetical protein
MYVANYMALLSNLLLVYATSSAPQVAAALALAPTANCE